MADTRKETTMKKKLLKLPVIIGVITLMLLMNAFVLTGCGKDDSTGDSDSEDAASSDLREVTVILDWVPNTNHTGLYVANTLGYYEEVGLDVDLVQPAEGAADQLVAVGQAEFGVSVQENVTYALTSDDPLPIKSIATIIQHDTSGFVSLKEEGIESPADWEGKTYGGWGSPSEEFILKFIAEKYGIDYEKINQVNLGEGDVQSALRGDIDLVWVFEAAELVNLDNQGVEYNYIAARDIDPILDYYTPLLIAGDKLIEEDPELVRAFTEATAKGYEYAIANPEEAANILLEAVPELDEYVVIEGQKYLSERYALDAPQWGWQEENVWARYADRLFADGYLSQALDAKSAFTNEFLPEK
jgi:ABC-type nitrate/sulfonate/bicarbonate transport system substrate-binding protein